MHGRLSEIGLIEVLQLLERGRRSGVLKVASVNAIVPVEVHIAEGCIVAVEPAAGDDATRSALVARHLVAGADSDDTAVLARPAAVRLRAQLAAQALETMIYWRQGRFDFVAGPAPEGPLSLAPDALVFDLVGREGRRADLSATLEEFRVVPDFTPDELLGAGPLPNLSADDWRLLDRVDGVRDIQALAAVLDDPVEDVATRIQALEGALILELHAPRTEDGEAWRVRGLAEIEAGRFEAAIDAWQHWRDNDPDRAGDAAALIQAARTMVEALRDARD